MFQHQVNPAKLLCSRNLSSHTLAQSSCDDADLGYYVPATGQSTQTECVNGTYQELLDRFM